MITADQLVLHALGDYVIQSDWMANNKQQKWIPALFHALSYTVPFLVLTQSIQALLFICLTHLVIDHYRLARYVCFAKNFLSPRSSWPTWSQCTKTGYPEDRPAWLTTWLLIITDNLMHVACNALAINYL